MYANAIRPYPAYKPSGVEWLGDVPEHWVIERLSTSVESQINGVWGSDPDGTDDLPCIRVANFDRRNHRIRTDRLTLRSVKPSERPGRILRKGNLLLEKSGGGEQQPVGAVMLYDHDFQAVCSNFVGRMVLREHYDPNYQTYLHATLYAIGVNKRSIKQTTGIQNIDASSYLSELVGVPPLPEQAAIVRYLDYVDRRIGRYVAAKLKLIALLEEEKQAIVNRAVTRGLDPNVRLKPSGVEWLGDVPEHWEVRRLRTVADMRVSNVDKHTREDEVPVRLCNYVDVYKNDRITSAMPFMAATASRDEIERFRLESGDVLITKDSETWDDIGVPALVAESAHDLLSGYHLALLRPTNEILGSYLARTLQSKGVAYQFHVRANGVTRYGLTHNGIQSVCLPLPPLPEQTAIVEYLDKATADIDAAIVRARRQIELVQEYRTRLIADVVTGKLDVREAAAQLPDETDDQDPIEESGPLADGMDEALYDIDESAEELAIESEESA